MVLNELGQKISNALAMVNNAETIDEKVRVLPIRNLPDHPLPSLLQLVSMLMTLCCALSAANLDYCIS